MNIKRMRSRSPHRGGNAGGGGGGSPPPYRHSGPPPMNRNHVFDSSGPDMRLRGTAQQLFEKYLQLGRDATGAGDRVMAESYFQHAEHYFRILNAMAQAQQQNAPAPPQQQRRYQNGPEPMEPSDGFGDQPDFGPSGPTGGNGAGAPNGHAREREREPDQDGPPPEGRDPN